MVPLGSVPGNGTGVGIGAESKSMKLLRRQQGQSAIEYVLVVGAVAVVIAAILMVGFSAIVPQFAGLMCSSVDTAGVAPSCLP